MISREGRRGERVLTVRRPDGTILSQAINLHFGAIRGYRIEGSESYFQWYVSDNKHEIKDVGDIEIILHPETQ